MNRLGWLLLVLLLLQGALTAVLYLPGATPQVQPVALSLVPAAAADLDEIHISDEQGNETLLSRRGQHWLLPELEALPADNERVEAMLTALTENAPGWPVADSVAARQRFQVADYRHQRMIELRSAGDTVATLLLGTSPGFRKVHVRNRDRNAIHSIALTNHDVPGEAGAWLQRRLLQVRAPLAIDADGYSLRRQGSDWVLGSGASPDPRELEALLGALRSLQVEGVADEDTQRELAQQEAELILRVESLAGEATLELFQLQEEHYILSSEFPLFFRLSGYDFDRLTGIDAFMLAEPSP